MPTKKRIKKIKPRDQSSNADALWEWQVPLALLIVGFVTLVIGVLAAPGDLKTAGALVGIVLYLVLYVPLTVAAMYIVASFLGVSFGFLNTALLKLAGITLFTLSLNEIGNWLGIPILGWLVALIATYFLFSYCFYLDAMETIKSVVLISAIRYVLGLMIAAILAGIMAGSSAAITP
jgi:hypothetical protein